MVGQDEKSGQSVALTSTDGNQWVRVASFDPDAISRTLAQSVTNLVFIGSTYQKAESFWYSNNPNIWVVGEPAPVFDTSKVPADVIFLDGLFLAAKNMESERSALLFTFESGQTWLEIARFKDAEISSLARNRQGQLQ